MKIPFSSFSRATMANKVCGILMNDAAFSTTLRVGVHLLPLMTGLVMTPPSQWKKWIISSPAMPGKMYLCPPEKPTTSCGNTGPKMKNSSYSKINLLMAISTSSRNRPSLICSISSAVIFPMDLNDSGLSHSWLKKRTGAYLPFRSSGVIFNRAQNCSSLIG